MSLLRKLLPGDKLSKYEKEQKRRYKQYVKLGTTNTIVSSKSESEIYQDYLIRRSLRRSKRKPAAKLPKGDDIFRDLSPTGGLSAAPAVLDAVNRNICIGNIPDEHLNDLRQLEVVTIETHTLEPNDDSQYFEIDITDSQEDKRATTNIKDTQPLNEKFAYGNQDRFLDQLDEVIRTRNKGYTKQNVTDKREDSPPPIYENTVDLREPPEVPVAKPRKKTSRNSFEERNDHKKLENEILEQEEPIYEVPDPDYIMQTPTNKRESNSDFYQSEYDELIWGSPPTNTLTPVSRSNSCVTSQSEDSFFDCISEDGDIYDDEEKNVMKQISPHYRERIVSYNESERDFRSLGSEDDLDQESLRPPQYDSVVKEEKGIVDQTRNTLLDTNVTHEKVEYSNISEDSIEPDSLEAHMSQKRNDDEPHAKFEEPDVYMTSWAERVRIKEYDFASDENSREKTHHHEEVQRHDEALLLEEARKHPHAITNFKDDPEFLHIQSKGEKPSKNHLIKLENNNDYSDIDRESDRNDGKKVTFDFAKSYCQTYEIDNCLDDEEVDKSNSQSKVFNPDPTQLYFDKYSNGVKKMQKHNLENLYIPTDDRSKVFLSYGVQPTPTPEEEILDRIFEHSRNMDVAFLNCMDGFSIQIEQPKPRNTVKIIELEDEIDTASDIDRNKKESESKDSTDMLNETVLIDLSISDQTETLPPITNFTPIDKEETLKEYNKYVEEDDKNPNDLTGANTNLHKPDHSVNGVTPHDESNSIWGSFNETSFDANVESKINKGSHGSDLYKRDDHCNQIDHQTTTFNSVKNEHSPYVDDITANETSELLNDDDATSVFKNHFSGLTPNGSLLEINEDYERGSKLEGTHTLLNTEHDVKDGNVKYLRQKTTEGENDFSNNVSMDKNLKQSADSNHFTSGNETRVGLLSSNGLSNETTENDRKADDKLDEENETEYEVIVLSKDPTPKININQFKSDTSINPFALSNPQTNYDVFRTHQAYIPNRRNSTDTFNDANLISSLGSLNKDSFSNSSNLSIKSSLSENNSFSTEDKPSVASNIVLNSPEVQIHPKMNRNYHYNPKTLNRSTSAPFTSRYKKDSIYTNRNIFTNKPLNRSSSHVLTSPSLPKPHSPILYEPYKSNPQYHTNTNTAEDKDILENETAQLNPTITEKDEEEEESTTKSLAEIQRRLSEVRNMENAEMQLATMQRVLASLKGRADMLESKTDDEYVKLLQTLFKSIRIVSGLQCNYDQNLLTSQQKTLKDIKECITELNFK